MEEAKNKGKEVINALIEDISGGNKRKFSELVNKNYQQVVDWNSGKRNITLNNFIDIIQALNKEGKNVKVDFYFKKNSL